MSKKAKSEKRRKTVTFPSLYRFMDQKAEFSHFSVAFWSTFFVYVRCYKEWQKRKLLTKIPISVKKILFSFVIRSGLSFLLLVRYADPGHNVIKGLFGIFLSNSTDEYDYEVIDVDFSAY